MCGLERGPRERSRSEISWGSEEQQRERAMSFLVKQKTRRKRYNACDELAEKEGFELAVQALLRFWVCEAADAPVGHPTGRAVCEAEQAHP